MQRIDELVFAGQHPATNIYALGVTLFKMLTGQKPFTGEEPSSDTSGSTQHERIRYTHLNVELPDPTALNPSIPPALAR